MSAFIKEGRDIMYNKLSLRVCWLNFLYKGCTQLTFQYKLPQLRNLSNLPFAIKSKLYMNIN